MWLLRIICTFVIVLSWLLNLMKKPASCSFHCQTRKKNYYEYEKIQKKQLNFFSKTIKKNIKILLPRKHLLYYLYNHFDNKYFKSYQIGLFTKDNILFSIFTLRVLIIKQCFNITQSCQYSSTNIRGFLYYDESHYLFNYGWVVVYITQKLFQICYFLCLFYLLKLYFENTVSSSNLLRFEYKGYFVYVIFRYISYWCYLNPISTGLKKLRWAPGGGWNRHNRKVSLLIPN